MSSTEKQSSDLNKVDLMSKFRDITGSNDENNAKFYLESQNWDLNKAIVSYFDNLKVSESRSKISEQKPSNNSKGNDSVFQIDSSTKISTLDSIKKREKPETDDKKVELYNVGGGQQVSVPKSNSDELVSNVLRSAKEHGGQVVSQNGKESVDILRQSGTHRNNISTDSPKLNQRFVSVIFWNNGFTVSDGPLRSYYDQQNKAFLNSLSIGRIPQEIREQFNGHEVDIDISDHRSEDYVQQKNRLKPFSGEGYRLADNDKSSPKTQIDNSNNSCVELKKCEEEAQIDMKVDSTKPSTDIQIRLSDGTRLVLKMNTNQTIARIRQFIVRARPDYNGIAFSLMSGFPKKELKDESLTIKDAKLEKSCIFLKLK